jgi:outer membrane protein, multidrug efflux system
MKKLLLLVLAMTTVAAFASGPKYKKPDIEVPANWQAEAPFRAASPQDSLPKGKWWEMFGNAELNSYEEHALQSNQTLAAAIARLNEARAAARITQAGLYPELDANPSIARQRISGNRPNLLTPQAGVPITQNVFTIPFNLNYEVDLFGSVRNNVRSAGAQLQAEGATLENVRLILTSELAADFFQLRSLDSEIADVQDVIEFEQKGLDLVNRRHDGGAASGLDVAQQQTVLDSAYTQLELLKQQRAQFQHALAVLQGIPAPNFVAPSHVLDTAVPNIPVGLPSQLLERRPDIAAAERRVAAANAQIGVARAAFFPSIVLGAVGGIQSTSITSLVSGPSALWSIGLSALEPVFAGGRIRARYQQSKSFYDESVAGYRESALEGFQQVEDALSSLRILDSALKSQQRALADARKSLDLANIRYTGGLVSYLDVITAQEQVLADQRLATQLEGQRVITAVLLVKALGGGWDASSLAAIQEKPTVRRVLTQ